MPTPPKRKSQERKINMDQAVNDFIACKRIAVVGASRDTKKFGAMAYKELKERGYQVFAVNPAAQEVFGDPCYPNLTALKGEIDGVLVTLPADKGLQVLQEAASLGLRNVWIQQQAESPELMKAGQDLQLNMVTGKCILMYAPPVRSFHGWHRGFIKFFGKL
jgi:uncharacterized protein